MFFDTNNWVFIVDFPDPGGPHNIKILGSALSDVSDDDLRASNIISSYEISPKIGFCFKLFNNDFASIQTIILKENLLSKKIEMLLINKLKANE
jgi:hypothetical protein